jgi:ferric-dicitrate binding protein FerR (iron transport regulator)
MQTSTRDKATCSTHEQRVARELRGERLTEEERAELRAHRSACESCRVEEGAARLLRYPGEQGPLDPLDDLQAQRLIAAVVEGVDHDVEVPERQSWPRRFRRVGIVAVLALLLSGGALVLWLGRPGPGERPTRGASSSSVQLLLRSGRVSVDGQSRAVGRGIAQDQLVEVAWGQAVLGLPDGGQALVGPDSAVRVRSVDARRVVLAVDRGEVLLRIPPGQGRRRFEVVTRKGRVKVTGTVFRVRVDVDRVTVAVLRGRVQLVEKGYGTRMVGWGQATYLQQGRGPRITWSLSAGAIRHFTLQPQVVVRLEAPRPARLTVRSRPPGALVLLNGTELGLTPLTALVRPGHHRLSVRRAGYTVSTEQLTLVAGGRVERSLVLHRLKDQPAVTPKEPPPAAVVPSPAPRRPARPRPAVQVEPLTVRDLLAQARRRSIARDFAGAARAYRGLIKQYGPTPQAVAARVSLGLILLDHLSDPLGALRLFQTYLRTAPAGPLAQEAAHGRIRVLRRLGRRAAQASAIRDFLRHFPRALQRPVLERRLRQLQQSP